MGWWVTELNFITCIKYEWLIFQLLECCQDIRWHFIGHLQKNKISRVLSECWCTNTHRDVPLLIVEAVTQDRVWLCIWKEVHYCQIRERRNECTFLSLQMCQTSTWLRRYTASAWLGQWTKPGKISRGHSGWRWWYRWTPAEKRVSWELTMEASQGLLTEECTLKGCISCWGYIILL